MSTTAKSVERALALLEEALDRDQAFPASGVRGFLLTARTGAEAAARLLLEKP